jgi:Tol biopolymer transport system component
MVLAACDGEGVTLDVRAPVEPPSQAAAELALWDGGRTIKIARLGRIRASRLRAVELGEVKRSFLDRVAWSPDGRRMAFTSAVGITGASVDVWTIDVDGGRLRRLTSTMDSFGPVWSPDGRSIVYARLTDHGRKPEDRRELTSSLWVMDPDGSNRRQLTDPEQGMTELPWSFSPDGSKLAVTRARLPALVRRSIKTDLVLVNLDSSGERELSKRGTDPAFSPDGSRIAYTSARDRNGMLNYGDIESIAHELYVMNADGGGRRRLTRTRNVNERAPSWSPDGSRIAYHRGRQFQNAEIYSIWQANADGSCQEALLAGRPRGQWYASPVWRPGRLRARLERLRC